MASVNQVNAAAQAQAQISADLQNGANTASTNTAQTTTQPIGPVNAPASAHGATTEAMRYLSHPDSIPDLNSLVTMPVNGAQNAVQPKPNNAAGNGQASLATEGTGNNWSYPGTKPLFNGLPKSSWQLHEAGKCTFDDPQGKQPSYDAKGSYVTAYEPPQTKSAVSTPKDKQDAQNVSASSVHHCPVPHKTFADNNEYQRAFEAGKIQGGEPYIRSDDPSNVHFAGSDVTYARHNYEKEHKDAPPKPTTAAEAVEWARAKSRELDVQAAKESSIFSSRGFLASKAGRAMMGSNEGTLGMGQLATRGAHWAASIGGYFPNKVSDGISGAETWLNDKVEKQEYAQQVAREAAGLRPDQWDLWAIGGRIASPANWVAATKGVQGVQWAGSKVPQGYRLLVNNLVHRVAAAGLSVAAVQPSSDGKLGFCKYAPDGRVIGVNYSLGFLGGPTLGGELLLNYRTGQNSLFVYGGGILGWNGGANGSGYVGLVYGLGQDNSNYAGGFSALTGSAGLFNGSVASSSGGVTDLPNASPDGKVMAYSGGVGGSLLPWRYGVNVSTTHYSQPINVGKYWMFPQDIPFFLAKQVCQ